MKKILNSLPFKLLLGVAVGIVLGLVANEAVMNVVVNFALSLFASTTWYVGAFTTRLSKRIWERQSMMHVGLLPTMPKEQLSM